MTKEEREKIAEEGKSKKVLMRFGEDMFYNDQTKPYFEKGKVYEVKGADQIERWLKRGGVIVEGTYAGDEKLEAPVPVKDHLEDKSKELEAVASGEEKTEDDEKETGPMKSHHHGKAGHGKAHHGKK